MRVVCVGSGLSLTREDVKYCLDRADVCVVNDNWRMAPWATWLYAADHRWWISTPVGHSQTNEQLSRDIFAGQRVTCDPGTAEMFGLRYVPHEPGMGLGLAPAVRGTLSGIEAINFVVNEGATQIILLGYDMGAGGLGHWFGDHPETVTVQTPCGPMIERMNNGSVESYADACNELAAMARDIEKLGIEVVNCTRRTALSCFRRSNLEDVF